MPHPLKMKFPQTRVAQEEIPGRLQMVRAYIALTRIMHGMAFPDAKKGFGGDLETLLVLMCVFVGDADGRPMSASKIANYSGLTRATVYRRLECLMAIGKIVRVNNVYYCAKDVVTPDIDGKLAKTLANFPMG